jgi:hypothetical protein
MNRRSFFKLLSAAPVIPFVPKQQKLRFRIHPAALKFIKDMERVRFFGTRHRGILNTPTSMIKTVTTNNSLTEKEWLSYLRKTGVLKNGNKK